MNEKFHAHAAEENESGEERTKESEEYVLISTLIGSIYHGSDTWLIYSGASKHMTTHIDSLTCLT